MHQFNKYLSIKLICITIKAIYILDIIRFILVFEASKSLLLKKLSDPTNLRGREDFGGTFSWVSQKKIIKICTRVGDEKIKKWVEICGQSVG